MKTSAILLFAVGTLCVPLDKRAPTLTPGPAFTRLDKNDSVKAFCDFHREPDTDSLPSQMVIVADLQEGLYQAV